MQFISILRKPHVSNKYAIAHFGITVPIIKEKEVLTINTEPFFRKLRSECAPLPHCQPFGSLSFLLRVREESNGEAPIRQL